MSTKTTVKELFDENGKLVSRETVTEDKAEWPYRYGRNKYDQFYVGDFPPCVGPSTVITDRTLWS